MIFHIHIDGHKMSEDLRAKVALSGFTDTPFRVDKFTEQTFAPEHHFTFKTDNPRIFKNTYERTISLLDSESFEGYVEGECVPLERYNIETNFKEKQIKISGSLKFENLKDGEFRESEIHIRIDSEKSDPRFSQVLRDLGFMSVFVDKDFGLAEILTVQGRRDVIKDIEDFVVEFLRKSSGVKNCTIKREDVARFWLSSPNVKRSPIVSSIENLSLAE